MLWHIAKKDLLSNIISARFIVGFILCLFLIPFSILINLDDYKDQMRLYQLDRDNAAQAMKQVRVYSMLRPEIVNAPEPLSVFCRGISHNVGNRVKIWLGEKPLFAEGKSATQDNPFLGAFFSMDFITIVIIIMSLLAFIFSYDICPREKEDGTLKMQLSNSISRAKIIAGKVTGIFLTLLPILIFCYLLGSLIILFSTDISFSSHDWGRVILLFLASILYLSIFIFIGLFISTRIKSSITSVIVCLFFWVFFVFIVPNLSVYLAENFIQVQSRESLNSSIQELENEFYKKSEDYSKTIEEPDCWDNWYYSSSEDGAQECYGCSKSLFEWYRLNKIYSEPLRIDYADKKWAFQKAYLASLDHQRQFAEQIALISPSAMFRSIAASLCQTDFHWHQRFMDQARAYRLTFIRFFQDKNMFASYRYFTAQDPASFMTADEIVRRRTGEEFQSMQELDAWSAKQSDWRLAFKKLTKVAIPGEKPEDHNYLDISDVPVFQPQEDLLFSGLSSVLIQIGLIFIGCVLLFYFSFLAFIKYDVR
jgi:ABC-type transport system involved in multi-copper enzyme maturation permease subunit